jgi:hypothetical protein
MQEGHMFGFLENVKMIVENQWRCFNSLPVQCCQNCWMKLVVVEILAFPYIGSNNESGFRDLRVRYLLV